MPTEHGNGYVKATAFGKSGRFFYALLANKRLKKTFNGAINDALIYFQEVRWQI